MLRLFLGACLIGFAPILVKLVTIGPTTTALYRCAFAFLFLALLMAAGLISKGVRFSRVIGCEKQSGSLPWRVCCSLVIFTSGTAPSCMRELEWGPSSRTLRFFILHSWDSFFSTSGSAFVLC